MTDESTAELADGAPPQTQPKLPKWAGVTIVILSAVVVVVMLLLIVSILEHKWESARPVLVAADIGQFEADNAKWGKNYPLEYDSYKRQDDSTTKTMYGGAYPRDYLADPPEGNPNLVIMFAGYGFSKDYLQARGHIHAVDDIKGNKDKGIKGTGRVKPVKFPGTCWTCKSPDVPRMMGRFGKEADPEETDPIKLISLGAEKFYASNFHDLKAEMTHPIGCLDCHDPKTMALRISRPALREAYKVVTGKGIDEASHQEMRSLVCAQCHVEYYFKGPGKYLTFPWKKGPKMTAGTSAEKMIEYYDENAVTDFVHPISKTKIIKAQHPDYEMYMTGVHAFRNVSCADCHMPYRNEGGMKVTDHHIQSPLLNISNSCAVCHRWSEADIKSRVETIQTKVANGRLSAERVITRAHFDVAAAMQAKGTEAELAGARKLIRHAQFRWDYVAANNGMGFHSPQESMRLLGRAISQAQEARIVVARLLGKKGVTVEPKYPDFSRRASATAVGNAFKTKEIEDPKLLP